MKHYPTYQINGVVVEERVSRDMLDSWTWLVDDGPAGFIEARKLRWVDFCG